MTVKMLRTSKGSPDGAQVETYHEGQVYDLPPSLARVFVTEKWAAAEVKVVVPDTPEIRPPAEPIESKPVDAKTPKRKRGKP